MQNVITRCCLDQSQHAAAGGSFLHARWCSACRAALLQRCLSERRKGRDMELCVHHIFVMLRVLRLSPKNPVVWQLSLIGSAWQADSLAGVKSCIFARKFLVPTNTSPNADSDCVAYPDQLELNCCSMSCQHYTQIENWMKHSGELVQTSL